MNSFAQFLTRRRGAPKHVSDEQLAAAIATLPPDHPVNMPLPAPVTTAEIRRLAEVMYPPAAPTFTPTARNLANTAPFPAAAPPVTVAQGSHARTGRQHVPPSGELLRRVRDGIQALPPTPAAVFAADFRTMPNFKATARAVGWCGLHMGRQPSAWARYSAKRWHEQGLAVIAAQTEAARAELRHAVTEWAQREARVRAAADAALALGYPGSAL